MRSIKILALLAIAALFAAMLSVPVYALNVYSNPSTQTGNASPDGTYNEGYSMQTVSDWFVNRCSARGFATRDSNWLTLTDACNDAVAWGANAFVAIHTNAGGGGWGSAHGTSAFYYQDPSGWYDANDRDLCVKTVDDVIAQFGQSGRGAKWANGYYGDWSFYGYHLYVLANTPNMNTILVEGLFHDNYDDVQLLKTDTGKNEYAEGLYRGVCDHYGYTYGTALDSAFNGQSYSGSMKGGDQVVCWVEYKNTGSDTWSNSGSNPVRLGTWNPQDRNSIFYTAGDWPAANRPTAMDQATTAPNAVGRFSFIMTAPKGNYGTFTEYWKLVSEYRAWFGYEGVWFQITTSPYDIVVDNNQGGFSTSANWSTGTSSADKYGADYRFRGTAAVSDAATWTVNVPTAGNYDVYAWWPQGANRSATAPYIVSYNGGSATVSQNQQANGGKWNLLGRYNFNAGNNTVKLSCWTTTGYVVVADAVRMVGPY